MSPNIFGECILDPSESQLRHKWKNMNNANCNDTAPLTPALNSQLIMIQNGILISLISQNSQVNMVVWFDCCAIFFK